jgi:hypothetical protein
MWLLPFITNVDSSSQLHSLSKVAEEESGTVIAHGGTIVLRTSNKKSLGNISIYSKYISIVSFSRYFDL